MSLKIHVYFVKKMVDELKNSGFTGFVWTDEDGETGFERKFLPGKTAERVYNKFSYVHSFASASRSYANCIASFSPFSMSRFRSR